MLSLIENVASGYSAASETRQGRRIATWSNSINRTKPMTWYKCPLAAWGDTQ